MKKFLLSIVMVCAVSYAMAQSLTSYYMPDAIERRNLNAAFAPERGYVAIPLVGSTYFGINGNLSLGSLIQQNSVGDLVTILDSSITSADALDNLSTGKNFTSIDSRFEILNFGKYRKDNSTFWSVNLGLRTNASYSMPYEFFEFIKLGQAGNMSGINIYAESFIDLGFGYSKVINEKLTVGGRAKILVGLASANLNISKFDVKMDSDEWAVTAEGELDVYAMGLSNEGVIPGTEFDGDNIEFGENGFSPAGLGFAIDLGAEYQVIDRLKVSLAVNDLGFIKWNQKSNVSAVMATTQSFAGVEVNGIDTPDFELDDINFDNDEAEATTRFMQATINAGGEYKFLDELIGVGMLYSASFWRSKTVHNLVGSASVRPVSWFTFAASYGFTNNKSNSLGLAANFSPSWFNFFIATDMLMSKKSAQYIPINQSSMSVSLGLAVPLGKRSLRSKYTELAE